MLYRILLIFFAIHNHAMITNIEIAGASKRLSKGRGLVTKVGDNRGMCLSALAKASFSKLLEYEEIKMASHGTYFWKKVKNTILYRKSGHCFLGPSVLTPLDW